MYTMTFKQYICVTFLVFTPFLSLAQNTYDANGDIIYATTTNATTSQANFSYEHNLQAGFERQLSVKIWRAQSTDLQAKISALNAIATSSVKIPILFGVSFSDFSPNFGVSRDGGARTHEGEDIMGVKGTPIVSPTQAVVIRMGTGATEGNFVSTANPGGETFVYMHLDRIGEGIEVGKSLEAGDLIGYLGDTGNAAGGPSHLHFEVRNSNGVATDPFPRLTDEFTIQQKMTFITKILTVTSDPNALAQFLVLNFKPIFIQALNQGVGVPIIITNIISNGSGNFTTTGLATGSTLILSRNLFLGISGEDVRSLQKFLNHEGFNVATIGPGSFGFETAYFGPATRAAVIKFQISKGISPSVGYVGTITRGLISTIKY